MSHPGEFWCSRRLIVTVEGPQGKSVVPLARPFARIGRVAGSDIVLNSPWVAKRSVYLHATDEGVFCFYLQPEENHSQRMGYWLAPGEPLMVGPYRISACLEGDGPGAAPAIIPLDDWGSAAPPYPVFQVYSGGKLRDKRRFRARLNLIGRRHQCALQVQGQEVSAYHGCLYWHYPRLWYVDLVSSNGTRINGAAADCAEVRIGDRLVLGEFTLLFQRLSKGGTPRSDATVSPPAGQSAPDMLPPDFEEDLPLELDDQLVASLDDPQSSELAGSSPVIPLERSDERPAPITAAIQQRPALSPAKREVALADAASVTITAKADKTALAPVQQTRQELALLQRRVEELTQLTAQAGKNAAQQLAQKTREAFERERQRIAQELERRGSELACEKLALEAQWQTASRELATQVHQLRDEATLLARQRQAMEQSRLLWDAQRSELERQLRSYAEQLRRLERGAGPGLPAPDSAANLPAIVPAADLSPAAETPRPEGQRPLSLLGLPFGDTAVVAENEAATAMVLAAAQNGGTLTPRSHVVDAHVQAPHSAMPPMSGLPGFGAQRAGLAAPSADSLPRLAENVLEGSMAPPAAGTAAIETEQAAAPAGATPTRSIKGRKSSAKGKEVFDVVTDRMVEMEQGRRQTMIVLGVAVSAAVVALAAAMIVAAVLLR